ncbi:amino acid permease [Bombella saccharophila]|uniref:Amino acid permease n=1 Tax=Bombella saccharophila TaxID=2967338 RepID=A0ABT3W5Y4_9PROT|nr:amino acid permease [Bombella saccharophila]MCX5613804.1 amino acid permease [Bombella saccharophila]
MKEPTSDQTVSEDKGLSSRHIAMIALGGVIGAGLFVGSSAAIAKAGPGIALVFVAVGFLIMAIMRMLGEIVVSDPGRGSFVEYIRLAHGDRIGFASGWLYWFFWVVVIGSEAIAGAMMLRDWIHLPVWVLSVLLIISMKLVNFFAPKIFGECEFWLSSIKVFTIVAFILLALLYVLHVFGHGVPVHENLFGRRGLFPNGIVPLLALVPTVLFTMMGSEISTVAAAETSDPGGNVSRVTRTLGLRIMMFYVSSICLITMIVPWWSLYPGKSPFVAVLKVMGVPGAALIMQIAILSAVLSCLNSSMYITSRILTELAIQGDAPAFLVRSAPDKAPRMAITISSIAGLLVAFSSIFAPSEIFGFLLNCSGGLILLTYALISTSYIVLRGRSKRAGTSEHFTMMLYPYLSIASLIAIILVFVAMLINPGERETAFASLGTAVVCYLMACNFASRLAPVAISEPVVTEEETKDEESKDGNA